MSDRRPIGVWLVPAPPSHRMLAELITELAREYNAPAFEPHITLHAGLQADGDGVNSLLETLAAATEELELVCGETGHTGALFKTLFIQFDDRRLLSLHRHISSRLTCSVDHALQPHLSLLYKELPQTVRRDLASRYTLRGERVLFDELAAVHPGVGQADWLDVPGWVVGARWPLRARVDPRRRS